MSWFGDLKIYVILPAAGCGERFSQNTSDQLPKQHAIIQGKSLLSYTIDAFLKIKFITKVVVVLDDILRAQSYSQNPRVTLICGKATRHRSIKVGLAHLSQEMPDIVIIHDGVRPLVDEACILNLCKTCIEHQACGYMRPLVSTVVEPDSRGFLKSVLKRSVYKASETPQGFKFEVLWHSYNQCTDEDLDDGTECLDLVLKYARVHAKLIEGTEDLWKVTYRKDLYTAAQCLADLKHIAVLTNTKELQNLLQDDLGSRLHHALSSEVCHLVFSHCFLTSSWVKEVGGLVDTLNWGNAICVLEEKENSEDVSWALQAFASVRKCFYIVHCKEKVYQMEPSHLVKLAKILKTLLNQMDDSLAGQVFTC